MKKNFNMTKKYSAMTYSDMSQDDQKEAKSSMDNDINYQANVCNEAFSRKSKMLFAGNAGGAVMVVTYFGAITKSIDYFIVISLAMYFLGMVSNGVAVFLDEIRTEKSALSYLHLSNLFLDEDSKMTVSKYQTRVSEGLNETIALSKKEYMLEIFSGLLFVFASTIIIAGMFKYVFTSIPT